MTIYEEMIELLSAEFRFKVGTVEPDRLLTTYGLDSLALVELMFTVEEHFRIDLPTDGGRFETLRELAVLIDGLLQKQAA